MLSCKHYQGTYAENNHFSDTHAVLQTANIKESPQQHCVHDGVEIIMAPLIHYVFYLDQNSKVI